MFFVLSGFLVGGSVLRTDFRSASALMRYAAARVARIWPVLLGAIGLSLLLNQIGGRLAPAETDSNSVVTIMAHMLALNNLGFERLSNNLPLWSISNEVAYYIFFPVLIGLYRVGPGVTLVLLSCLSLVMIAASLTLTPLNDENLALYAPIWLLGACLWLVPLRRYPLYPGVSLLLVALVFARTEAGRSHFFARDLLTAIGFSLCLLGSFGRQRVWAERPALSRRVAGTAAWLASFSFSLYATHGPIIELYRAVMVSQGHALPLTEIRWSQVLILLAVCLIAAWVFSLAFERYHGRIANALTAMFAKRAPV